MCKHPGSSTVLTGLDVLCTQDFAPLRGLRIGLLVHPASIDRHLRHALGLFHAASGVDLRALFGPQHGLRGETQDNMIEWQGFREPMTGLPAHSLYGEHRKPTSGMLSGLDTLVVDLQDVGARYYTFIWTLLLCMEACAEEGKRLVVLDRPNPLGCAREGNLLDMEYCSFVGMAPIPIRHGLTIGELARYFRAHFGLKLDLEVIPMQGFRAAMQFPRTGLPWVLPSPNLPTYDSALVYPGMCLLEGTQLSEGRGTTRPFEIFGAPYIDPDRLCERLAERAGEAPPLEGIAFRPLHFEPTFNKYAGQLCGGLQLHVIDCESFRPVRTALAILAAIHELYPGDFRWLEPPYEYEHEKMPIDILAGGPWLREGIERGADPQSLDVDCDGEIEAFSAELDAHQLYS